MATGFLVTSLTGKIKKIRDIVNDHFLKTLYIHISVKTQSGFATNQWVCKKVNDLYSKTAQMFPNLDVRIILNELKMNERKIQMARYNVDVVILPQNFDREEISLSTYGNKNLSIVVVDDFEESVEDRNPSSDLAVYDNVVLGGTFDRLHAGHKILLSEALLRCQKKLTVGVTDTCMLQGKKLWELIEPCQKRIGIVQTFIQEVDPSIECEVVPITDMFGPTKSDPSFNMIVVSAETHAGGMKVNEVRKQNGLNALEVHVVDLVLDDNYVGEEENKFSSSNSRMRLLGTRIRDPVPNPSLPSKPYIIGLTGGVASGKSSIANYLGNMGAGLIDCDKIAHDIYKSGSKAFSDIVKFFGTEVVGDNGEINRKVLGRIVFSDKKKLEVLNNLLWPAIIEKSLAESQRIHIENKKDIVVMEAAVLLQAGWHKKVHEVWTSFIPRNEAVKRLMERNSLSEEEANARLNSQPSNCDQLAIANVAFSTLWSREYTLQQVERAWKLLKSNNAKL